MTTITIQSNFQAEKIINMLKSDGVKFESKTEPTIKYGKIATTAHLNKILYTVCSVLGETMKDVRSSYRGGEVVHARKVYCYVAKTMFPYTSDEVLVSVLKITRSTLTSHKLEISERINGKVRNIPENILLKKSIDKIFSCLDAKQEIDLTKIFNENRVKRLNRIKN